MPSFYPWAMDTELRYWWCAVVQYHHHLHLSLHYKTNTRPAQVFSHCWQPTIASSLGLGLNMNKIWNRNIFAKTMGFGVVGARCWSFASFGAPRPFVQIRTFVTRWRLRDFDYLKFAAYMCVHNEFLFTALRHFRCSKDKFLRRNDIWPRYSCPAVAHKKKIHDGHYQGSTFSSDLYKRLRWVWQLSDGANETMKLIFSNLNSNS